MGQCWRLILNSQFPILNSPFPMLRITIDTTPILPKPSGIGFYVMKLLEELTPMAIAEAIQLEPIYQISLKSAIRGDFSAPTPLLPYKQLKYFPLPVKLTNLFIRYPKLFLPLFERSLGFADIFHGTNYTVFPFRHSRKVMTVYDLTFIKYPHYSNTIVQAYADRVRRCLRWTDLILTISASSKQDIVEYLGFPADRIVVTPLASRYGIGYQGKAQPFTGYDLARPFILFVSTIEPRKNLIGLIEAFDYLKRTQKIAHDLVLVGQKGWLYEPIFERIARSPYRESIHHLDYLPDEQVAEFYRRADVFVYPSHYEGFGLPVLEAMTLGCPVVCSDNSSLPEVAGDAAVMIDAADEMAIADGIARVIGDRAFRQELVQCGYDRAARFSWRYTAEATLRAYRLLM
jgi:glycosyltransferase involved in cell wall biosynthesis